MLCPAVYIQHNRHTTKCRVYILCKILYIYYIYCILQVDLKYEDCTFCSFIASCFLYLVYLSSSKGTLIFIFRWHQMDKEHSLVRRPEPRFCISSPFPICFYIVDPGRNRLRTNSSTEQYFWVGRINK